MVAHLLKLRIGRKQRHGLEDHPECDHARGELLDIYRIESIGDLATWEKVPTAKSSRRVFAWIIVLNMNSATTRDLREEVLEDTGLVRFHEDVWIPRRRTISRSGLLAAVGDKPALRRKISDAFDPTKSPEPSDYPVIGRSELRAAFRDRVANPKDNTGRDEERVVAKETRVSKRTRTLQAIHDRKAGGG